MRSALIVIPLLLAALLTYRAEAGVVTLAPPTVESDRFTFPIELDPAGAGVASMDFQVRYDPAVFSPVSATVGASASAAGKLVDANLSTPGSYNVLVMGLNQTSLPPGEVAQVVFQRNPDAPAADTRIALENPTLADGAGAVLPATGGERMVRLGDDPAPTGPDDEVPGTPEDEAPKPTEEEPPPVEVEPDPGGEDQLGGQVGQDVADALLSGLSRTPPETKTTPREPGDPSPRVSGEETPEMKYSIRERRYPLIGEPAATEAQPVTTGTEAVDGPSAATPGGTAEVAAASGGEPAAMHDDDAETIEDNKVVLGSLQEADRADAAGGGGEDAPSENRYLLPLGAAAAVVLVLIAAWYLRARAARL